MTKSLFDDIQRTQTGPGKFADSTYHFLNTSARTSVERVREVMDEWYAVYPNEHSDELKKRIRKGDERPFRAAFFELFLFTLFRRLGFVVEIHPPVTDQVTTRPDFLIGQPGGKSFYLEATVVAGESDSAMAAAKRLGAVYDLVNELESPDFFIHVKHVSQGSKPPSTRGLREFLKHHLTAVNGIRAIDPSQFGESGLPIWTYCKDGWEWHFEAIPKNKLRGKKGVRAIGMFPVVTSWGDGHENIRSAISKKASRYGEMDRPYVVALNALDHRVDDISIEQALFGEERWFFPSASDENGDLQMGRDPKGLWIARTGPTNTRLSGVMAFQGVHPWNVATVQQMLYHNPWASRPLDPKLLPISQAVPDGEHLIHEEGMSLYDVIGLSPNWPLDGDVD